MRLRDFSLRRVRGVDGQWWWYLPKDAFTPEIEERLNKECVYARGGKAFCFAPSPVHPFYVCTLEKGHSGDHVGHYGLNDPCAWWVEAACQFEEVEE